MCDDRRAVDHLSLLERAARRLQLRPHPLNQSEARGRGVQHRLDPFGREAPRRHRPRAPPRSRRRRARRRSRPRRAPPAGPWARRRGPAPRSRRATGSRCPRARGRAPPPRRDARARMSRRRPRPRTVRPERSASTIISARSRSGSTTTILSRTEPFSVRSIRKCRDAQVPGSKPRVPREGLRCGGSPCNRLVRGGMPNLWAQVTGIARPKACQTGPSRAERSRRTE